MTARRKCPAARTAKGGVCERPGCLCIASIGCRICSCCAREQGGASAGSRLSELHKNLAKAKSFERIAETTSALRAFESELLAALAGKALPPAKTAAWTPQTAPRSWGGR